MSSAPDDATEMLSAQIKEMQEMMRERGEELDAMRSENATLKSSLVEAAGKVAGLESSLNAAQRDLSSAQAQVSALSPKAGAPDPIAQLKAKDEELATLRTKTTTQMNRLEALESELIVARKRSEQAYAQLAQEKDDEITALKEMFLQVSEKRKESFLQLKDRLRQASEMLQTNQAQHAADAQAMTEMRETIDRLESALKEKNAQLADYASRVHSLEHEKGDLFQRTSDELMSAKSEVREAATKAETIQKDLEAAKLINALNAEKAEKQITAGMRLDSEGGACENGSPVRLIFDKPLPSNTPMQWYRSYKGSSFQSIPGKLGTLASYTPTVDDIGATLKLEIQLAGALTPNLRNIPVSREFGPIGAKRTMVVAVLEHIKKADMIFSVDAVGGEGTVAGGKPTARPQILLNREKIKLRSGGKTIAKAGYGDELRVLIDPDTQTRFALRVDNASNALSYSAASSLERDLIVQSIRSFNTAMIALIRRNAPPDNLLALAYLIRSGNEARGTLTAKAAAAAAAARAGDDDVGRRRNKSDDFGFLAGTGVQAGSHPSTPNHAASAGGKPGPIVPDTPRSALGGGINSPAPAGAGVTFYSTPKPSNSPTGAGASASSSTSAPVAVAKIKGSNGEDLDVDADGFVIREDHGWPEAPAVVAKKERKPKGEGDDSDFSADEEELESKPSIKVKINNESRAPASGEALRNSIVGFGLQGGGALGATALAAAKLKRKQEKKEKKEKKRRGAGGIDEEGGMQSPDSQSQTNPPGGPDSTTAASSGSATDAYRLTVSTGNGSDPSPRQSFDAGSTTSGAGSATAAAAATNDNDDLFAFLDSEAQKPMPSLGVSPAPVKSAAGPAPAPMVAPSSSASSIPSAVMAAPVASKPSPSSSSASSSSASAPSPALARTASGSSPGPDVPQVDILVLETLHARVLDGEVIEYAVWGEILLNLNLPAGFVSRVPLRFDFQLFNTDSMSKVAPNSAVLTSGFGGAYSALIPADTAAPLCVLKYKVNTDLSQAKKQVPLLLQVGWKTSPKDTVIDVDYRINSSSTVKTPLLDVKFLITVAPVHCIKQCTLAVPKCMFSPQSQKLMWQLPNLPTLDTHASSGKLHAELLNADVAAQPAPLSVSFMSDDLEGVVSGILVMEAERNAQNSAALPLGRLIYRIKSGIFSVL